MTYNPHIHHRRSIRLKGYDYSQGGLYFITICCQDKICRFGNIENGEMILNDFGTMAYNEWTKLPERFPNFELDVFQIMPNHMHGIIMLHNAGQTVGETLAVSPTVCQNTNAVCQKGQPQGVAPTIGGIVGAYKSLVFNGCLKMYKSNNEIMGKLWQRNYYEIIIRNEQSYQNISNYIINNPAKWAGDKFHIK